MTILNAYLITSTRPSDDVSVQSYNHELPHLRRLRQKIHWSKLLHHRTETKNKPPPRNSTRAGRDQNCRRESSWSDDAVVGVVDVRVPMDPTTASVANERNGDHNDPCPCEDGYFGGFLHHYHPSSSSSSSFATFIIKLFHGFLHRQIKKKNLPQVQDEDCTTLDIHTSQENN